VAAPSESIKRCFTCGSKYHLKNECPDRNKLSQARANTKVNACHLQTQTELAATHITLRPTDETNEQSVRTVDAEVQVCVEPAVSVACETQTQTVGVNSASNECQSMIVDEYNDCQSMSDDYAKLQYIDVKVTDQSNTDVKVISGLCDSGAEISVLRTDVLGQLDVHTLAK